MEVYLDNSATTRCSDEAIEVMTRVMREDYGNPSSMHRKGVESERYVVEARRVIAKELHAEEKEIYFTSGGTESNNMAIIGTALANRRRGMHLITSSIEHPSVKNAMLHLQEQGYEITWLSVNEDGLVNLEELRDAIREDTVLVSVMHVNNEIGSLQPLEQISKTIKEKNQNTYFHVDSVQGIGKLRINVKRMGIDLLSASAHKFHGPKGVGFLYVKSTVKTSPILFGGGQQKNMRSGTENVPGIAGMAEAFRCCYENLEDRTKREYEVRNYFLEKLEALEDVVLHGPLRQDCAPHVISASFLGVRSEVLLHSLEEKGIYVSAGSACSSHKKSESDTLKAIRLSKNEMESNIRFSLDEDVDEGAIDYVVETLKALLPILRRYQPH